jgi:hypothetical protein
MKKNGTQSQRASNNRRATHLLAERPVHDRPRGVLVGLREHGDLLLGRELEPRLAAHNAPKGPVVHPPGVLRVVVQKQVQQVLLQLCGAGAVFFPVKKKKKKMKKYKGRCGGGLVSAGVC